MGCLDLAKRFGSLHGGLNDSQDDSQHGGRLGIVAVGSEILTPGFELWRTSMDGGGRQARGLQNR